MKTSSFSFLAIGIAALGLALLCVNVALSASLIAGFGIVALALGDYRREVKPRRKIARLRRNLPLAA